MLDRSVYVCIHWNWSLRHSVRQAGIQNQPQTGRSCLGSLAQPISGPAHPQLGLYQQQLRSKAGNGKTHIEIPISTYLFHMSLSLCPADQNLRFCYISYFWTKYVLGVFVQALKRLPIKLWCYNSAAWVASLQRRLYRQVSVRHPNGWLNHRPKW